MNDKKKIKLFGKKQTIILSVGAVLGIGFAQYQLYKEKGGIDTINIISAVGTVIIAVGIFFVMKWWGNKSEKS
jgi:hypothetical protein